MKRGFVSVIVILAIFLASIIMVNVNYQDNETISFKEEMLNSKLIITNYEIVLNRAMDGKNLTTANIDGNSTKALEIITPAFTNCNTVKNVISSSEADIELTCITNVIYDGEIIFKNEFSKTIKILN